MKWKLITVGDPFKNKELEAFYKNFLQKINHLQNLQIAAITDSKIARVDQAKKKQLESEKILASLADTDYLILFDENGKTQSSREFAKFLEKTQVSSAAAVFLIGGPFGVNDEVKKRAQIKIRLSDFVLNHELALAVALEQIYRGLAILKNLPYHND